MGDLSTWVLSLHGLSREGDASSRYREMDVDESTLRALGAAMGTMLGPYLDPKVVRQAIRESENIRDETKRSLAKNSDADRKRALNSIMAQKGPELLNAWGIPADFYSRFELSADESRQMLRAFRAVAVSLLANKTHVVTLVVRAEKGQRQAVLDLIKVDRMFLHDCCTEQVIKTAEMLNDRRYLDQIMRAQEYKFKPNVRSLHHLYFYLLFVMDSYGMSAPATTQELCRIVDPHGTEFKSFEAFERDFQRRRRDFQQIMQEANSELQLK